MQGHHTAPTFPAERIHCDLQTNMQITHVRHERGILSWQRRKSQPGGCVIPHPLEQLAEDSHGACFQRPRTRMHMCCRGGGGRVETSRDLAGLS